ncbi:MAG: hypothetical protein NVS3B14_11840 [Ktedonobacteraceae bacterium]
MRSTPGQGLADTLHRYLQAFFRREPADDRDNDGISSNSFLLAHIRPGLSIEENVATNIDHTVEACEAAISNAQRFTYLLHFIAWNAWDEKVIDETRREACEQRD